MPSKQDIAEEKAEMAAYLDENLQKALALGGASPKKFEKLLGAASDFLIKNNSSALMADAAWIDRFGEIPENMAGHIDLFKVHGFSAHDAVEAALKNPQMFVQPYADTAGRVEDAKKLLTVPSLGMKDEDIFPFYTGKPRLFTYDPETVADIFKMGVIFMESPYVAFQDDLFGSSFRQMRVDKMKSRFGSVSNTLLRMVAGELSFLAPKTFGVSKNYGAYFVDTTNSFHRIGRGDLEKRLAVSLGFKGKGAVMDAPDNLLERGAQRAVELQIKKNLRDYVRLSTEDFDQRPAPSKPDMWNYPILQAVTKDGAGDIPRTPAESRELRAYLALGGILKKYKLDLIS